METMTDQSWQWYAPSTMNHFAANSVASIENKSQDSVISCRYYDVSGEEQTLSTFLQSTTNTNQQKQQSTKQSRQLPHWAWYIIAKCFGIPLHPSDKPIIGLILHVLTFASALTFTISHIWFVVFDILSPYTPVDIANGTISIFLIVCWGSFGFYAKNLNGRMFQHPQLLRDIRMHSRTIFKINAVALFFMLGALFISANDYDGRKSFFDETCEKIELNVIVCKLQFVSRVVFSILALIWHSMVSFVMISVCRTHTIGIRRFIRELEYDGAMYEHYLARLNLDVPLKYEDICQETSWLDADLSQNEDDILSDEPFTFRRRHHLQSVRRNTCPPTFSSSPEQRAVDKKQNIREMERMDEIGILTAPLKSNEGNEAEVTIEDVARSMENKTAERPFIPVREMRKGATGEETSEEALLTPHTMSTAEILHHYWKIYCRLRLTSAALQRWFISLICLVILWCAVYLVYWLSHPATAEDILQFILPLIILVLLSSALAEVNMEGQRMTRCICPTDERLRLLQFLGQNPLMMPMYGFSMTHGTIITVIFAILVGFTTRIIITEMTK